MRVNTSIICLSVTPKRFATAIAPARLERFALPGRSIRGCEYPAGNIISRKFYAKPACVLLIFFKPLAANLILAVENRNRRLIRIRLLMLENQLLGLAVILECLITVQMIRRKIRQQRDLRGLFALGQLLNLKTRYFQNNQIIGLYLVENCQHRLIAYIAA